MAGPISPGQATQKKLDDIPEFVFDAFNEAISADLNMNGCATVMQGEVADSIVQHASKHGVIVTRNDVFARKWLDVENHYRQAGWRVVYDKPAYNENYEANFRFSPKD